MFLGLTTMWTLNVLCHKLYTSIYRFHILLLIDQTGKVDRQTMRNWCDCLSLTSGWQCYIIYSMEPCIYCMLLIESHLFVDNNISTCFCVLSLVMYMLCCMLVYFLVQTCFSQHRWIGSSIIYNKSWFNHTDSKKMPM